MRLFLSAFESIGTFIVNRILFAGLAWVLSICACQHPDYPDLIVYNAKVYTVDSITPYVTAFAVKNGVFVRLGSDEEMQALAGPDTEKLDAEGRCIVPGLIEGHGHFSGLGQQLLNLDFLRDTSWAQIVDKVSLAVKTAKPGDWIVGRGWHQEKWTTTSGMTINGYPLHQSLSAVSPNNPVLLYHASGHSLFANQSAMKLAGISAETSEPSGGVIVRDASGKAIGVFEERAMSLVQNAYEQYRDQLDEADLLEKWYRGIDLAQELCLSMGITSFQDAGTRFVEMDRYRNMAEEGKLKLRLWSMIRENMDSLRQNADRLPVIDAGNGFFTCNAVKSELDGALGVFGAWKLKPYADKPGYYGQNTTRIETLREMAGFAWDKRMQFCVHAIGDRANREFLNVCEEMASRNPELVNARWRSEHAQHIDTADLARFPALGVLASMQGIHCTSDAPFVIKRLGYDRSRTGAYAWRSLLDKGVRINNGTDAPVESVNPFECLYASVSRKRLGSDEAFFPEQAMTREEALHSYTLANAYAAFQENQKGSIQTGKLADFVLLDKDIMQCAEDEIPRIKVIKTYVGGKCLFTSESSPSQRK